MKYVLIALSLSLYSASAHAEAYWQCQCFESEEAGSAVAGVELVDISTLKEAEATALAACRGTTPSVNLARCLKFVGSDH
jgi:hypothetical protein